MSLGQSNSSKMPYIIGGIVLIAVVAFILFTTRWTNAGQGEGVIMVKQPYFFGESGVEKKIYPTGKHFHWMSTKGVVVDLTPMRETLNFNDLATDDKIPIDFAVTVAFALDPEEGYVVIDKYITLKRWFENNFREPLSQVIRQGSRARKGNDMMYDDAVISQFRDDVLLTANNLIAEDPNAKVIIKSLVIGKANPPDTLIEQINETARQKERDKTELERFNAETTRKQAEGARAAADLEYRRKLGMTNQEYLVSRQLDNDQYQIDVMKKAVETGKDVKFFVNSGGQSVQPVKEISN
tara:strand:- start:2702 stop:3589 length:888 start_codon:yes stop_codon:yes gene_type:complete